jgi:phosphopantothenoylcysteine decarboxylase/phosphopantothenate--cysteine ligase
MLIAPATASTIGKMANGIADNMLITTYLSMKAPVFIAPAMDLDMFAHPVTQRNIEILKSLGNRFIEPASGFLASKLEGKGRMEEPDVIVETIEKFFITRENLINKKILITAGPTYENIDPVRYIGNHSSGKMGFALAEACAEKGADVVLITGPVQLQTKNKSIRRVDVVSADEMFEEVVKLFPEMDAAILSAAVADYKPVNFSVEKIKRESGKLISIELTPNRDIAAELGRMKIGNQILIGFALETQNEEDHAKLKLKKKNFDFIVLNSLRDQGAGFKTDTNKVSIIKANKEKIDFPLKTKSEVANDIVGILNDLIIK